MLVLRLIVLQLQQVALSVMRHEAGGYSVTNASLLSILGEGIQASLIMSSIHQTVRNLITRRGSS